MDKKTITHKDRPPTKREINILKNQTSKDIRQANEAYVNGKKLIDVLTDEVLDDDEGLTVTLDDTLINKGRNTMKIKEYTLKGRIEDYATVNLDYDGFTAVERERPMTLKQANYLSAKFGGFVSQLGGY